jgi:hypothetical protein
MKIGTRLMPLDALKECGESRVQVSIVLDVLGVIEVSAGCRKAMEDLPVVVVGILIGPALAFEDLYGFIILSKISPSGVETTDQGLQRP